MQRAVPIVGFDHAGHRVLRKKIKRLALKATFETLPRCVVGMEACMSAHFVSRMLRELGFEPRIIPAIYVKPFNKGQKNDYNDAEAIAEAAMRPSSPPLVRARCLIEVEILLLGSASFRVSSALVGEQFLVGSASVATAI